MTDLELRERIQRAIKARQDEGETLEQIAAMLGVHWTTVHHWLYGRRYGNSLKLLRLVLEPRDQQAA